MKSKKPKVFDLKNQVMIFEAKKNGVFQPQNRGDRF
jgi:hypothetical protein